LENKKEVNLAKNNNVRNDEKQIQIGGEKTNFLR
jgi:hypothetical protein